jgi:hypothetical protein
MKTDEGDSVAQRGMMACMADGAHNHVAKNDGRRLRHCAQPHHAMQECVGDNMEKHVRAGERDTERECAEYVLVRCSGLTSE